MTADHQADVLGEAVDEVKKSWPRVGVTSHHQTLGSTSEKHPRKNTKHSQGSSSLLYLEPLFLWSSEHKTKPKTTKTEGE